MSGRDLDLEEDGAGLVGTILSCLGVGAHAGFLLFGPLVRPSMQPLHSRASTRFRHGTPMLIDTGAGAVEGPPAICLAWFRVPRLATGDGHARRHPHPDCPN